MNEELELTIQNLAFKEYIDSLVQENESVEIEFKSAKGGFPNSFWETYSAFANTEGGTIVLGIKEKGRTVHIEGLDKEQLHEYKTRFWRDVNNKQVINQNLLKEENVKEGEYQGKGLLVFSIPRATRTERPVHKAQNPLNGNTFKRNYEGDYRCTDQEVRRMIADSDDLTPPDARILDGFTIDDIDLTSLRQYRQLFASLQPTHPWLTLEDIDFLTRLGGYRLDRRSGKKGFTLAGLLMFGKFESIKDPECAPNFFPDYREYFNPDIRWSDRIIPDGTREMNLFQFYLLVSPRLSRMLPKPFKLEGDTRVEEGPAHVAIREAFVNTLVHADYCADGNILIEQKSDRFVFSNPGNLLISRYQYYHSGGNSICRNKSLQQMFMLIGRAEKAGSGVDKILKGWEWVQWKTPYMEEFNRPDKVMLTLSTQSLLAPEIIEELKTIFGEKIDQTGGDELKILAYCISEGYVTNEFLQIVVNLHPVDITKMLRDLCLKGYLRSDGHGRGTRYYINDDSSDVNDDSSKINDDSSFAEEEMGAAKPKRLKTAELDSIITNACVTPMTLDDLVKLVGKSRSYLMNKVIPRLIESDQIRRVYPKNSPNQKYQRK